MSAKKSKKQAAASSAAAEPAADKPTQKEDHKGLLSIKEIRELKHDEGRAYLARRGKVLLHLIITPKKGYQMQTYTLEDRNISAAAFWAKHANAATAKISACQMFADDFKDLAPFMVPSHGKFYPS